MNSIRPIRSIISIAEDICMQLRLMPVVGVEANRIQPDLQEVVISGKLQQSIEEPIKSLVMPLILDALDIAGYSHFGTRLYIDRDNLELRFHQPQGHNYYARLQEGLASNSKFTRDDGGYTYCPPPLAGIETLKDAFKRLREYAAKGWFLSNHRQSSNERAAPDSLHMKFCEKDLGYKPWTLNDDGFRFEFPSHPAFVADRSAITERALGFLQLLAEKFKGANMILFRDPTFLCVDDIPMLMKHQGPIRRVNSETMVASDEEGLPVTYKSGLIIGFHVPNDSIASVLKLSGADMDKFREMFPSARLHEGR